MDMIVLPLTPNHVRLIIACYPAAPQAAAPEYRPNSQELSRLTYYASNRPGKLHKLASELEKRAKSQARRAQSGHAKARAQLLVTLGILKALTAECRKDLSTFSSGVLSSVETALKALPSDLEVAAHAAGLFTSWTTYTDGTLLGVDEQLSKEYFFILDHYAKLSVFQTDKDDLEVQNRERLVGLAALSSAIQSDALFNSMSILGRQVNVIVPALLKNVEQAGLSVLGAEATAVETYSGTMSPSPYVQEFQPMRPITQRRAPSIHVHVDGEKGPSFSDVVHTVLHALRNLLAHSNALQVPVVLEAAFNAFDSSDSGWNNMELCQWLVSKVTEWTQFQYRFAVPTRLLERLVDARDAPEPTNLHFALTSMIAAIFTSSTPLINLSTSDVLSNLLTVIIARLNNNPKDALLPSLVDCVASLGTHIYYSDQIQDLAEEIVNRLVGIQVNGLNGRGRLENEKGREEGLRCLVACLAGLLKVAEEHHQQSGKTFTKKPAEDAPRLIHLAANMNLIPPPMSEGSGSGSGIHHSRRNKVAVEVWQDTVALLCESEFSVRNDYATTLVKYLQQEIDKEPCALEDRGDGSLRNHSRFDIGNFPKIPESDSITRFLHALHASAFTLAITPSLGLISSPPSTTSHASSLAGLVPAPVNIIPPTPMGTPKNEVPGEVTVSVASPIESPSKASHSSISNPNRRSIPSSVGRPRAVARGLSLLDPPANTILAQAPSPATASDYSLILNILSEANKCLPVRCLFVGVPMLLAMDAAAKAEVTDDQITLERKRAVREVVGKVWLIVARVWDCEDLKAIAEQAVSLLDPPSTLPPLPHTTDNLITDVQPHQFEAGASNCTGLSKDRSIDLDVVTQLLAGNSHVQKATGLDEETIRCRLLISWTATLAIGQSVEAPPTHDHPRENANHFLKISPGLMHIDNKSLHSIARTVRGVGVGDLREALEGRGSMSNTHLPNSTHSVSTDMNHGAGSINGSLALTQISSRGTPKARKVSKNTPKEVADVLNKLGVGKTAGSKMLRTPFNATKGDENSTTPQSRILVPPYGS